MKIIDEFMMLGEWKGRLVLEFLNYCLLKLVGATRHDVELKRKWVEIGVHFSWVDHAWGQLLLPSKKLCLIYVDFNFVKCYLESHLFLP